MSAVVVSFVLGSLSMAQAAGTASQPAAANPDSHALSRLFADYWQFRLRRDPERATYLGDHRYDDQLYDYSPQARELEQKLYEAWRGRLARINRSRLSESEALSADLFERTVNDFIELSPFGEHLMPIRQQDSPQIALGMLHVTHPFRTAKDCNNYVVRLRRFDKQVYDLIKLMDEGLAKGLVRPKVTIEAALKQIEGMIVEDPTASILYEPAKSLTGEAGGEESRKLIEQGTRTATRALRRLRDYLNDTYLSRCRQNVGYCFLPNGKAWYVRLARMHTTTDLTPEAMHQLGLDELKRIHAEMEEIMREVGFKGDVQAFIAHIRSDPAQHNKTAEEIMRRHAEILKRSDALLPKLFGRLPATPYGLKEIEAFRAEAAPEAYYYDAPDDGSRSAYFYVNVSQATTRPIYTMEALAYHEAQPGHHLQIALARENSSLPTFRRYDGVTAFVEGWALYSERLGKDLGGYRDPYSRFGQLTFDTWRSARLVVDTGMHYMGWTREQAFDFMKKNTGLSEQNIGSEVDRYIAWPGQALAYKVGEQEILKLRREAEARLGSRFDIRAFHDHLLAEGALPMDVLRKRMTRWIEQQTGPSTPLPAAASPGKAP